MSSERASTWALIWGFLWRFTLSSGVVTALCSLELSAKLHAYDQARQSERAARLESVSETLHRLTDGFSADVERIRRKALDLRATQNVRGALGQGLLHWAELYADDAHVLGVRRSLPGTAALSSSHEAYYLALASAKVGEALSRIRKDRIGLLRVEDAMAQGSERLVFVFPLEAPESNVILAMVDPGMALSALAGWHGAHGLRMYLADRDGKVLIHSEKNYVGASLEDVDVYSKLATGALGSEPTELARAKASDALNVTAAGVHPLALPLLLAVEAPLPLEESWLGFPPRTRFYAFWVGLALMGAFGCAIGATLWMWFGGKKPARPAAPKQRRSPSLAPVQEAPPEVIQPPAAVDIPPLEVLNENAPLPGAFEAALVESAFRQKLLMASEEAPKPAEPPKRTLSSEECAELEKREREFIEEQLMDRFEDALIHERDPRKMAYHLTEFAQRLCEAPAAFFGFHSGLRSAILLHACALPPQSKRLVSFPLSDSCLAEISRAEHEGRVASLDGYLPIRDLLKLAYRVSDFRAWALTGLNSKLLGILVVFRATVAPEARAAYEPGALIERAVRSTGPLYEKNLHQQPQATN